MTSKPKIWPDKLLSCPFCGVTPIPIDNGRFVVCINEECGLSHWDMHRSDWQRRAKND